MRLSALYLHPIKSARAIGVREAEVTPIGFRHDRRWMIVDATGAFVTQRTNPHLRNLEVALHEGQLVLTWQGTSEQGAENTTFSLPTEGASELGHRTVEVWGDVVEARSCGQEIDDWLSTHLGGPHHLVAFPSETARPLTTPAGELAHVSFADGYPFLVASEASRIDLEARSGVPLAMERFRPNLVIEGAEPWAEDDATTVIVGDVAFGLVKPCVRCVVTTLDPEGGEAGVEPLRTLATFRRNAQGGVTFGVNAVARGSGIVRVGDPVRLA